MRHPLDRPEVDALWIDAAAALGLKVERTTEVYASSDGRGTLHIGTRETLDADDCLAVLVLHELCHGFVQGRESFQQPDFGLDNTSVRDEALELATLRLQAAFADTMGLRDVMFSTTEWRPYYEGLPADALAIPEDPTEALITERARQGLRTAQAMGAVEPIAVALRGTRLIQRAVMRPPDAHDSHHRS